MNKHQWHKSDDTDELQFTAVNGWLAVVYPYNSPFAEEGDPKRWDAAIYRVRSYNHYGGAELVHHGGNIFDTEDAAKAAAIAFALDPDDGATRTVESDGEAAS